MRLTSTQADGSYLVNDLAPGTYSVRIWPGYMEAFTDQDVGSDDTIDSDVNTTTGRSDSFTLASGEEISNIDAGLWRGATLGDRVWVDTNADGLQDWDEQGLDGVTVNLLTPAGTQVATTSTQWGGWYTFTGIRPGSYQLEFVLPTGYTFSPQDTGTDDTFDSDVDATTTRTAVFTLASGGWDYSRDAGLVSDSEQGGGGGEGATIGDRLWFDDNGDGIQDAGESGSGLGAVMVRLYSSSGALVATTYTQTDGTYQFAPVAPGTYYIVFDQPFTSYEFSLQDQGTDDTLDSDVDVNGVTALFTLLGTETDFTFDAGLRLRL